MFYKLFQRAFRFTLVGIIGALFDLSTRYLLLHLGLTPILARGGSYIVGSTVAYYLNSFFTFEGVRSGKEKIRAATSYVVCFTLAVLVDFIVRQFFGHSSTVLFFSWFSSQAAATVANFLLQNFWVFKKNPK